MPRVVTRLRSYGVQVDSDTNAYCEAILGQAAMKEWGSAAKQEPWLIAKYEMT
jgi:glutathione S-transferase